MQAVEKTPRASRRPLAILLMGPTGTGKTELALHLARAFPVGLISVDSALVYRGMDIGTAKPAPAVLGSLHHHLVDILDPAERYSAGDFRRDASAAMLEIASEDKTPLLVGGTLLYFRALSKGLANLPEPDQGIRSQLDAEAAQAGWPALHRRLAALDPVAAARIHPNDAQRIQRALEVHVQTGTPLSELQRCTASGVAGRFDFLRIGLVPPDRSILNENIERRFNLMLKKGFIQEVRRLYERGDLHANLPSMRAVGYRQLWQHLAGECSVEEATRRAIVATRRLAKRQMTWLRSERLDAVFDPHKKDLAADIGEFVARALAGRNMTLC